MDTEMTALAAAASATVITERNRLGMAISSLMEAGTQCRQASVVAVCRFHFVPTARTTVELPVPIWRRKIDVGDATMRPAAGLSAAGNQQDFGTSRWQPASQFTPTSVVHGRH
jgi:hypothetical protein